MAVPGLHKIFKLIVDSRPGETSKMDLLANIVNGLKPLIIFAESSLINV